MKQLLFIITLTSSIFSFSQTLSDSLLLHYSFNGNMNDVSGNNQNGTGNAVLAADRFGNPNSAYHFNGIDQYINFPNVNELKPTLPVSISFWVKFDSEDVTNCTVFDTSDEDDVSAGIWLTTQSTTGKFSLAYGDGSNAYSSATRQTYLSNSIVDTNTWHHMTLVIVSENDMKVYVDCQEKGGVYGGDGGPLAYSATFPGTIGRHDQNIGGAEYYFMGSVDDFRYYNRELTLNDINALCMEDNASIEDQEEDTPVKLYPNPANTTLNFEYASGTSADITIYSVSGEVVYTGMLQPSIDIETLDAGMYILEIKSENAKTVKSIRFIKE